MLECFSVLGKAFIASDALGRFIVIALIGASMFSFSIMFLKAYAMVRIRKGCRDFLRKRSIGDRSLLALGLSLSKDDEMPLDRVCREGIKALDEVLKLSRRRGGEQEADMTYLTQAELDKVRSMMVRQMNVQSNLMEDNMVILATIVQLAPFAGLLGTVWGVMMVFFQMGMSSRPEIQDMAPGVSSALLTTVVGLLVAMPAVLGNNIISWSIDRTYVDMETYIDDFVASLKLSDRTSLSESMRQGLGNAWRDEEED